LVAVLSCGLSMPTGLPLMKTPSAKRFKRLAQTSGLW